MSTGCHTTLKGCECGSCHASACECVADGWGSDCGAFSGIQTADRMHLQLPMLRSGVLRHAKERSKKALETVGQGQGRLHTCIVAYCNCVLLSTQTSKCGRSNQTSGSLCMFSMFISESGTTSVSYRSRFVLEEHLHYRQQQLRRSWHIRTAAVHTRYHSSSQDLLD